MPRKNNTEKQNQSASGKDGEQSAPSEQTGASPEGEQASPENEQSSPTPQPASSAIKKNEPAEPAEQTKPAEPAEQTKPAEPAEPTQDESSLNGEHSSERTDPPSPAVASDFVPVPETPPAQTGWLSEKAKELFIQAFGLDYRSLALLRIGCGFGLIMAIINRLPDMNNFFSDTGMETRAFTLTYEYCKYYWSVYWINGEPAFVGLCFAFTVFCGVMLILGYKSRLFTIISYIMFISLLNRNGIVNDGQEMVFRQLLFWGMFLPWGNWISLDALKDRKPIPPNKTYFSLTTVAYYYQIMSIYVYTANFKDDFRWQDGSAGMWSLNTDPVASGFGVWMTHFPNLLILGTHATWWFELLGSFLLIIPFFKGWFKTLGVVAFCALHTFLHSVFELGLFPLCNMISLVAFLPASFWEGTFRFRSRFKWHNRLRACLYAEDLPAQLPRQSPPDWVKRLNPARLLLVNAFVLYALVCISVYDYCKLKYNGQMPEPLWDSCMFFRWDHGWHMFARFGNSINGFFVAQAVLKNGKEVDLFTGQPITWKRPEPAASQYRNHFWRIWEQCMWDDNYTVYRTPWAEWLRNDWNSRHSQDEQVKQFQVFYMREGLLPEIHPEDKVNLQKIPVLFWKSLDIK